MAGPRAELKDGVWHSFIELHDGEEQAVTSGAYHAPDRVMAETVAQAAQVAYELGRDHPKTRQEKAEERAEEKAAKR